MTDPYIYDPGNPDADLTYSRHATISEGTPHTVRVEVQSDAIRELVKALDSVIQTQHETLYHAMRAANDTVVITMTRGEYNHLRAVADRYRPVDPTETPAERTDIDES